MDALDCPMCRRRTLAPGSAVCSLVCGALYLESQRKARPLLVLIPESEPAQQPERTAAA